VRAVAARKALAQIRTRWRIAASGIARNPARVWPIRVIAPLAILFDASLGMRLDVLLDHACSPTAAQTRSNCIAC
jgi:hypothetical protein